MGSKNDEKIDLHAKMYGDIYDKQLKDKINLADKIFNAYRNIDNGLTDYKIKKTEIIQFE